MRLTSSNPELDRLVRQTPDGMMHWSGTSTVPGATCGRCQHYGYTTVIRNDVGNAIKTDNHPSGCALFHRYTNRHGKAINPNTQACKYFAASEKFSCSSFGAQPAGDQSERWQQRKGKSMDARKYANGSFIGLDDVADGPIETTIVKVLEGRYEKLNLVLATGDKFSLNAGNTRAMIKAFGPNTDEWPGERIRFIAGQTKYQGKLQDSVIVEPLSAGKPEAEREAPPPADDDDPPF